MEALQRSHDALKQVRLLHELWLAPSGAADRLLHMLLRRGEMPAAALTSSPAQMPAHPAW